MTSGQNAEQPARRRRGPARSLTRDQVVEAAMGVLREVGLDAVSFRSVSKRLGVNPMALYTYVADKDELLAAMFDDVLRVIGDAMPEDSGRPRDGLVAYFSAAFRLMVEYADLYRLARPSGIGMNLDLAERVYRMVADLGVPESRIADVHLALLELTVGSALCVDGLTESATPIVAQSSDTSSLLATVFGRARELDHEEHFVHTFHALLDGLLATHGAGRPR